MRGLQRRIASGLRPDVRSVASLFISRSLVQADDEQAPRQSRDRLGMQSPNRHTQRIPISWTQTAGSALKATGRARATPPVREHRHERPPEPRTRSIIGALAASSTVNTIPEETLLHCADDGEVAGVLPRDGGRPSRSR